MKNIPNCTSDQKSLFGGVIADQVHLNDAGIFAQRCWRQIPDHFSNIELDEFVIMPNQVHGLICITHKNTGIVGVQHVY